MWLLYPIGAYTGYTFPSPNPMASRDSDKRKGKRRHSHHSRHDDSDSEDDDSSMSSSDYDSDTSDFSDSSDTSTSEEERRRARKKARRAREAEKRHSKTKLKLKRRTSIKGREKKAKRVHKADIGVSSGQKVLLCNCIFYLQLRFQWMTTFWRVRSSGCGFPKRCSLVNVVMHWHVIMLCYARSWPPATFFPNRCPMDTLLPSGPSPCDPVDVLVPWLSPLIPPPSVRAWPSPGVSWTPATMSRGGCSSVTCHQRNPGNSSRSLLGNGTVVSWTRWLSLFLWSPTFSHLTFSVIL